MECFFCDTLFRPIKYKLTPGQIVQKVGRYGTASVCITGGEPLLEKEMPALIDLLRQRNYHISIETNGSIDIKPFLVCELVMDVKCPSSGMHRRTLLSNLALLKTSDQVKFVISNKGDYLYAISMVKQYSTKAEVIMSPVFDEGLNKAKELAQWIIRDKLPVRLGIQLHKLLGVK